MNTSGLRTHKILQVLCYGIIFVIIAAIGSSSVYAQNIPNVSLLPIKNYLPSVLLIFGSPMDIQLTSTNIWEGQPINTVIGYLSTTDPTPGDTFTYSLVSGPGDTDNGSFNILANQLRSSVVFDYHVKSSYSARIRTTDSSGLFYEKAFTIGIITDVLINTTFEGDFPGVWNVFDNNGSSYGEYYWAARPCQAYAGSNSGWAIGGGANGGYQGCYSDYPYFTDSWMEYGPFSLVGATAAELDFKLWLNSEPSFDEVCRLASIDGTHYYGTCTSGYSNGWIDRILDLSSVYTLGDLRGQPNVWVAIIFYSDELLNYQEGAYVDNITLHRCMTGSCPASNVINLEASGNQIIDKPWNVTIQR